MNMSWKTLDTARHRMPYRWLEEVIEDGLSPLSTTGMLGT
jgi:hypothetical protein